jgi:hypothetical protein
VIPCSQRDCAGQIPSPAADHWSRFPDYFSGLHLSGQVGQVFDTYGRLDYSRVDGGRLVGIPRWSAARGVFLVLLPPCRYSPGAAVRASIYEALRAAAPRLNARRFGVRAGKALPSHSPFASALFQPRSAQSSEHATFCRSPKEPGAANSALESLSSGGRKATL